VEGFFRSVFGISAGFGRAPGQNGEFLENAVKQRHLVRIPHPRRRDGTAAAQQTQAPRLAFTALVEGAAAAFLAWVVWPKAVWGGSTQNRPRYPL
jgi:hypothetical protein